MNAIGALHTAILPTYSKVLPGMFASPEATVMLLAIGLQESRFEHRRQIGGPARGWWQFERGGGTRAVLEHEASRPYARAICVLRGVPYDAASVYERFEVDDMLACAFARLLLYTDPRPLPMLGDASAAWDYYIANWRPGKPHRGTWNNLYDHAMEVAL